jgi:hypothetical protein
MGRRLRCDLVAFLGRLGRNLHAGCPLLDTTFSCEFGALLHLRNLIFLPQGIGVWKTRFVRRMGIRSCVVGAIAKKEWRGGAGSIRHVGEGVAVARESF